ncbi:MAG TPA: type VI secretion system accessory protein TagJ [Candidatus Sulfotelmatobacter sp.]|jgi:type VI secretion system protein ImpE|nr:type VI secretion system accessory protein TagJ [Candidatus Sulfotelmatobacter sp.]
MNPLELYQAGRLMDAMKALSAELRDNPTDARRRTFLFELLCFAGEWERADKQLEVLGQAGPESEMGVLLYRSALFAERQRHDLFQRGELPAEQEDTEAERNGVVNDKPFTYFADADPRIGARLELFAAGNYLLLPIEHVASIQIPPPKRLRDLIWTPAAVRTTPSFKGSELGEVLLPVLAPFSWRHPEEAVRLGRMTVWEKTDGAEFQVPFGQKVWQVDDEDVPFLELRALEFNSASVAA